jgi:hypothetical protein
MKKSKPKQISPFSRDKDRFTGTLSKIGVAPLIAQRLALKGSQRSPRNAV